MEHLQPLPRALDPNRFAAVREPEVRSQMPALI
jgi:hypothetical protein